MAKKQISPEKSSKFENAYKAKPTTSFKSKNKIKSANTKWTEKSNAIHPSTTNSDNFLVKSENKKHFVRDSFFVKPSKKPQNKEIVQKKIIPIKDKTDVTEKKPFDKKSWRLKKYSKKYKLEQWESRRKHAVLRGYYRSVKDDEPKLDVQKIYDENKDSDDEENQEASTSKGIESPTKNELDLTKKKARPAKRAHLEFQRIQNEKKTAKEDALKKKEERAEAAKTYKKKKIERMKKLNRKTKKGQPIMKERMEMLLEKIQNSINTN